MAFQISDSDVVWRLDLGPDLSELDRRTCQELIACFGGTAIGAAHGEFRMYRTAEICARSLNRQLGVTSKVHLAPAMTIPSEPAVLAD